MKKEFVNKLTGLPKVVNDRLMTTKRILSSGRNLVTFISAYAPTMANPDEIKDRLYEELHYIMTSVPDFTSSSSLLTSLQEYAL